MKYGKYIAIFAAKNVIAKATHSFAAKIPMYFENTSATTVNEFVVNELVNALNNWARVIIRMMVNFWMTNRAEPDQTAALFIWVYTVCLGMSAPLFRVNTVTAWSASGGTTTDFDCVILTVSVLGKTFSGQHV